MAVCSSRVHFMRRAPGAALILSAMLALAALAADQLSPASRARSPERPGEASHVPDGGPCAAFAPGTDPEYVDRIYRALLETRIPQELAQFDLDNAWFGSDGVGGTLTYSFVPDGVIIPSGAEEPAGASVLFARMTALFGGVQNWKPLFEQTFARWTDATGIQFVEVVTPGALWDDGALWGTGRGPQRGDIRISMKSIDGAGGVLAYNQFPTNGDMVLDVDEDWARPFGGFLWLRNIVGHEAGHGIGLRHSCPVSATKLMEPFIFQSFDGPQHDDIRGAQTHYGDRFEFNGSTASATFLGTLLDGQSRTFEQLSLRNASDVDVFSLVVEANAMLTIEIEPVGLNYPQSVQLNDGACASTSLFDSRAVLDPRVEILNASGTAVTATFNNAGIGQIEHVDSYPYANPSPAIVYFRVRANAAGGISQAYTLRLQAGEAVVACQGDLNGDGAVGPADLALLLGDWGKTGASNLNGVGVTDAADLSFLLGLWGSCPG